MAAKKGFEKEDVEVLIDCALNRTLPPHGLRSRVLGNKGEASLFKEAVHGCSMSAAIELMRRLLGDGYAWDKYGEHVVVYRLMAGRGVFSRDAKSIAANLVVATLNVAFAKYTEPEERSLMDVRPSVAARIVLGAFDIEDERVSDEYEKRCAEDDSYRRPGWCLDFTRQWVENLSKGD